jgi:hypothetical protein
VTSRGQDQVSNDVTRAGLNKDVRDLLTTHFLASPHVYDTIEGLILAYYDWLVKIPSDDNKEI